jgi:SAM-dependent methyltransferase
MIEVRYEVARADGTKGLLRVAGGIWSGEQCVFQFADTVEGIAGTATCDWRRPVPRLDVHDGDASTPYARELLAKLAHVLLPFHSGAFADVDDAALRALYDGDYHQRMNLANGNAYETAFKRHMLAQLVELGPLGKVLDAGCSAGEVVRQLRARGVDAHGFDLCPDLEHIAYPEIAPFVRQGRVDAIPFGPEDGFDTVLALDVFEHVPEHVVPAMVRELARLGVRRVVAHIALVEFQYPGHLTLRPLSWWDRQLGAHFTRTTPAGFARAAAGFGADPARYLRVYELATVPAAV